MSLSLPFAIGVMGYSFFTRKTNLLSLGHSVFYGVGAYLTAFTIRIVHFEAVLVITIITSAVLALIIGLITLRLKGIYFTFLTFALTMIFYSLAVKLRGVTGGDDGLPVPAPKFVVENLIGENPFTLIILEIAVFTLLLTISIVIEYSDFGLSLSSIGQDEVKVVALGISPYLLKLLGFILSAIYMSIAGALTAVVINFVSPKYFYWTRAADFTVVLLMGGLRNFWGPIAVALLYTPLVVYVGAIIQYWQLVIGLIVIIISLGVISIKH
jgi:branched-chain amino acid transport system permease protein